MECILGQSKYFWYRSFSDISADIEDFLCSFSGKSLQIDNLDFVPFPTNQIVCRETEINQLFTFVCGWDGQRRLRNKKHLVCVSGYGGIGKTSLVTEFISRLIDLIGSDSYTGLCPEFILFYSSKIGEKYNDLIKSNYERCLMMLDTPSFEQIKSTKTYPSVLWIFAQFLLSIEEIDEASHYAHLSVQNFDNLEISSEERYDAFAIYGVAEAKLFPTEWDTSHLKNAREAYDKLKDTKKKNRLLDQHIELLKSEIAKYYLIKI